MSFFNQDIILNLLIFQFDEKVLFIIVGSRRSNQLQTAEVNKGDQSQMAAVTESKVSSSNQACASKTGESGDPTSISHNKFVLVSF